MIAEDELVVSLAPNPENIYHLAATLLRAGRPKESIPLYKKASSILTETINVNPILIYGSMLYAKQGLK